MKSYTFTFCLKCNWTAQNRTRLANLSLCSQAVLLLASDFPIVLYQFVFVQWSVCNGILLMYLILLCLFLPTGRKLIQWYTRCHRIFLLGRISSASYSDLHVNILALLINGIVFPFLSCAVPVYFSLCIWAGASRLCNDLVSVLEWCKRRLRPVFKVRWRSTEIAVCLWKCI